MRPWQPPLPVTVVLLLAGTGLLLPLLLGGKDDHLPARGFSVTSWAEQRRLEAGLSTAVEAGRIRDHIDRIASEPHPAGSAGARHVAEYALALFREWGYSARIETFEALLPYPLTRSLEVLRPTAMRMRLAEPALGADPDTRARNQLPPYNAYSADGDVTAPLVYVNYGLPEDYELLKRMRVSVRGKLVLARYGRAWRGTKVKLAAAHGALGCLLYSDPKEDGFFRGDTYPAGPWRPLTGVQRGSILDLPLYVGDPLTPGWASEPGGRRLERGEAPALPQIPAHPISAADAERLLRQLGGPVVPEAWRGALGTTYHVGPGPAEVRLRLAFDWSSRPVHSVVATLPGAVEPDQWVLYGNHHDAWVFGAADPASGAAALLETARVLSLWHKQGWRPRRTIRFALWDGEEFGLIGSTEWAEKYAATLGQTLVAYLNSDWVLPGRLEAGGSHCLERFASEVVAQQDHPEGGGRPLWQGSVRLDPLGAASDYVAFQQHLGVASLQLGFSGAPWGVYHSAYDTRNWYALFGDSTYAYPRSMAMLSAVLLTRLASAPLLPFEFPGMVQAVAGFVADAEQAVGDQKLDWRKARLALARLEASAAAVERQYGLAVKRLNSVEPDRLAPVNEAIYRSERAWLIEGGLPGRPWYRHALYAPGLYSGYTARPLPGIREPVEAGHWSQAREQLQTLIERMHAVSAHLDRLATLLRDL